MEKKKSILIELSSILKNDKDSIMRMNNGLKKRGYVLVELPNEIINKIDRCLMIMENFFGKSREYKKQFEKEPIFGYFDVPHKESFRFLTGVRLNEHKLPNGFEEVTKLINQIDKMMYTITMVSGLFPNIMMKADEMDIPLFKYDKQWGMFDVARYYNDGMRKEMNCKEHSDPGLLSISLRSTENGLQLRDENGNWNGMPLNKRFAIIWAGDAANKINPEVKTCIHRVINPPDLGGLNKARIAIWYEICTSAQEHKELMDVKKDLVEIATKKYEMAKTFQGSTGIPMSKMNMPDKTTIAKKFEGSTGIPISKSLDPDTVLRMKTEKERKTRIPISQLTGMPMFDRSNRTNMYYGRIFDNTTFDNMTYNNRTYDMRLDRIGY